MRIVPALGIALTLAALAAPLCAQVAPKPGRYHLGPLWITPKVELKNAGVDTNVFNSRLSPVPDAAMVLSPGLSGVLPIGDRMRALGSGFVDFNYFQRKGTERSIDFGGEGRLELKAGPFTVFGGGGGAQYRQRFAIDLDERIRRQEKWATTGLTTAVTSKTRLTISGTGRIYNYEHALLRGVDVSRALDRNSLTGSGELRYGITRQTDILATAEVIEDRFLQRLGLDDVRTARSFRYLGGFEFGPRAYLQGKALVGIRQFPAIGAIPRYVGPAFSVATTAPLTHFMKVTVSADRDVYYSALGAQRGGARVRNTYVSSRYSGQVSVELPLSLIARGSFEFDEAQYLLPERVGTHQVRRVDHLWSPEGTLLRAISDSVRLGFTVGYDRRVSNIFGASYQGLRYGVSGEIAP